MSEPAAAPKPIAGTAQRYGEARFKKPSLPEKALLLAYYEAAAPLLLEHAARRPLNLFRCTAGYCFFQRNRAHPASEGDGEERTKCSRGSAEEGFTAGWGRGIADFPRCGGEAICVTLFRSCSSCSAAAPATRPITGNPSAT